MINWPFRRHEPDDTLREQLRLVIKAARRCAHDLDHCASDVSWCRPDERKEQADMWHERAQMWQEIFYPDGGPKNYRDELHMKIWSLESERDRLRALLVEHKITDHAGDIPF